MCLRAVLGVLLLCSFAAHGVEQGEITVEQIAPNVFLHSSTQSTTNFGRVSSNGLIVVRENNAVIIDTPWSLEDSAALIAWVKEAGYQLAGVLATHSHEDRTGGFALVNSLSIPTYASLKTNLLLREDGRAAAQHEFSESSFWWLNGTVEVFYAGAGHTLDNHVVWLPEERILFGGCLIRSLASSGLGFVGQADLDEWPSTVQKLVERYSPISIVIPGHGAVGSAELLDRTLELLQYASKENH